MSESYIVQNISKGPISFNVFASYEIPEGTPKHKRRKMTKNAAQNVVIPPQQSRDLVTETGLTVAELKAQPELNKILHNRITRLKLLSAEAAPSKAEAEAKAKAEAEAKAKEEAQAKAEEEEAARKAKVEAEAKAEEEKAKAKAEEAAKPKKTRGKKKKK